MYGNEEKWKSAWNSQMVLNHFVGAQESLLGKFSLPLFFER